MRSLQAKGTGNRFIEVIHYHEWTYIERTKVEKTLRRNYRKDVLGSGNQEIQTGTKISLPNHHAYTHTPPIFTHALCVKGKSSSSKGW